MRAEQPASDNRGFAAAVLLWLHLLILIAGALQFAFAPQTVQQPMLAVGALALLTVSMLITRSIPALQRPIARQHWIDVISATLVRHVALRGDGRGAQLIALALRDPACRHRRCFRQLVARRAARESSSARSGCCSAH